MTTRPMVTRCIALCLGALVSSSACGSLGMRTGSETNFLSSCDGTCEDGLSCVCGVCTRTCSDTGECSALVAGAACVTEANYSPELVCAEREHAVCDRSCDNDEDCDVLGSTFLCRDGFCRSQSPSIDPSCSTPTLDVGENERSVQVGDVTRRYMVYVPESFTGSKAAPLVLDFHTLLGTPAGEADNSGYRELAEAEGFIVAYPEGVDGAWNIGPCCTSSRDVDDVAFARALVDEVKQEACIDTKRVYAVGVAMGGGMAYQLGCNAADLFAGIAPSSFDLLEQADQPCQPTQALSVISFRGTADQLVPYAGGAEPAPNLPDVTMNFMGAVRTFERWAELNQCTGEASVPDEQGCSTYSSCAEGTEVTLCTEEGGVTGWGSAERGWATLSRHSLP